MLAIPGAWDAEAERLLHPISLTPAWPTQKDLFLSKYRKQTRLQHGYGIKTDTDQRKERQNPEINLYYLYR